MTLKFKFLEGVDDTAAQRDILMEKHKALSNNMIALKARHEAALREISFLREWIAALESDAPLPPIQTGFPQHYILPAAPRTPLTFWKTAREKLLWSGLSAEQALHLELTCLIRLAKGENAAHFPRVLKLDLLKKRFELTDQGPSLKERQKTGKKVAVRDADQQIATIIAALKEAKITYLDMHPDGKNLCVQDDGHLSLIDFDITAIDGLPQSGLLAEKLKTFDENGGYDALAQQMREIIARLC
ncbi:MAG: hypothetical protein EA339_07750 [Rhodobacteraceae bacterium]|nr:MAG: hypothetical protein EA339_07750 [Paracoccaceae bacterium]